MSFQDFCLSKIEELKVIYEKRMGHPLCIEDPKLFTEKQQWLKIYDSTHLKTFCADKITVHSYVKEKLGKDICIPIISVYDDVNDIDISKLPDQFVIKCNHGCKMNIIVKDKTKFDFNLAKQKITQWLAEDYSLHNACELHYKNIPHKILIEVYKENAGHADLTDYKFYCLNGKPLFCQVITDRHTREKISHYDLNWNYAPQYDWIIRPSDPNIAKPKHLDEMIKYATILAKDFNLVRVDFYEIDNTVFLGEMTFTPYSGFQRFKNADMDLKLGNMLKL